MAIFHEMVAKDYLKGYRTLKTGYKETYDLWGYYEVAEDNIGANRRGDVKTGTQLPIVIEFKYKAESILSDFSEDIKFFGDIDLIVCWDLDEAKFAAQGVHVEVLSAEDALFHGSNYILTWAAAHNLGPAGQKPVMALRRFIEEQASTK